MPLFEVEVEHIRGKTFFVDSEDREAAEVKARELVDAGEVAEWDYDDHSFGVYQNTDRNQVEDDDEVWSDGRWVTGAEVRRSGD